MRLDRARPARRRLPAGDQGAAPTRCPTGCKLADYHAYWHGARRLLGRVAARPAASLAGALPEFSHPDFDIETRIVQVALGNLVLASVYVPNGGKDYAAKLRFLDRARRLVADSCTTTAASSSCAATSTSRAPTSTCIRKERKPGVIGQRPEERDAVRGAARRPSGRRRPRARSRQRRPVHVVGAVAQHAPAQHRLAHRLHPRLDARSPSAPRAARCSPTSAPAITRRS